MSESVWRRVWNSLGFGSITAIDDSGPVQRAQLKLGYAEVRDRTPVMQLFGLSAFPPLPSDAVLVFIGGDRSNGVVIATNNQGSRPTGQSEGESTLYNAHGMSVYLSKSGIVVNAGNQPVTVNNATTVTVNASGDVIFNCPLLKVSGDIIDNYGTNSHTMAGMRQIYDEHTHQVPNVQTGSSTVTTTIPAPQE